MTNTDTKNLSEKAPNFGATESKAVPSRDDSNQDSAGKPTAKAEQKKQGIVNTPKEKKEIINKAVEKDVLQKPAASGTQKESLDKSNEPKTDEQNKEKQIPKQNKPKVKKTEVVVNSYSLPISTKYSVAICRFIKNKKIETAIADLGQVLLKKKAVPMKGEIPHKKGKSMMSGRFPKKATEHFIKLLKSLAANANANDLNNPAISEAVPNLASRPYGRFGRIKRKRTHVRITAIEKNKLKKEKKNGRKKNS